MRRWLLAECVYVCRCIFTLANWRRRCVTGGEADLTRHWPAAAVKPRAGRRAAGGQIKRRLFVLWAVIMGHAGAVRGTALDPRPPRIVRERGREGRAGVFLASPRRRGCDKAESHWAAETPRRSSGGKAKPCCCFTATLLALIPAVFAVCPPPAPTTSLPSAGEGFRLPIRRRPGRSHPPAPPQQHRSAGAASGRLH